MVSGMRKKEKQRHVLTVNGLTLPLKREIYPKKSGQNDNQAIWLFGLCLFFSYVYGHKLHVKL